MLILSLFVNHQLVCDLLTAVVDWHSSQPQVNSQSLSTTMSALPSLISSTTPTLFLLSPFFPFNNAAPSSHGVRYSCTGFKASNTSLDPTLPRLSMVLPRKTPPQSPHSPPLSNSLTSFRVRRQGPKLGYNCLVQADRSQTFRWTCSWCPQPVGKRATWILLP